MSGPRDAKFSKDAGCRGAAEARYLIKPEYAVAINAKIAQMAKRRRADKRYVEAAGTFDSCMKKAGYNNKAGINIRSYFAQEVDDHGITPALQSAERAAAVVEYKCQRLMESRLAPIRSEYDEAFLQDNADLIRRATVGKKEVPSP